MTSECIDMQNTKLLLGKSFHPILKINLKLINPTILNELLGIAGVGTESNLWAHIVKESEGNL